MASVAGGGGWDTERLGAANLFPLINCALAGTESVCGKSRVPLSSCLQPWEAGVQVQDHQHPHAFDQRRRRWCGWFWFCLRCQKSALQKRERAAGRWVSLQRLPCTDLWVTVLVLSWTAEPRALQAQWGGSSGESQNGLGWKGP